MYGACNKKQVYNCNYYVIIFAAVIKKKWSTMSDESARDGQGVIVISV